MITLTTAVTSERLSERVEFTLDMLVVVAMRGVGVTVAVDLLSVDARVDWCGNFETASIVGCVPVVWGRCSQDTSKLTES